MKKQIEELLHKAMKEQNKLTVNVYRSLLTDIVNGEKDGNTDQLAIIFKARKKCLDSYAEFNECGRNDLAEEELLEADIISRLLPKPPTNEEVTNLIKTYYELHGKNMGVIIKGVKSEYPGIDGKVLSTKVKDFLNNA